MSSAEHPHRPHVCIRILIKSKSSSDSWLLDSSRVSINYSIPNRIPVWLILIFLIVLEVIQLTAVLSLHPLAPSLHLAQPPGLALIGTTTLHRPSVHHLRVLIPSHPPKRQTCLPHLPSLNINLGCHDRDSKEHNFYAIIQNKSGLTYSYLFACWTALLWVIVKDWVSE